MDGSKKKKPAKAAKKPKKPKPPVQKRKAQTDEPTRKKRCDNHRASTPGAIPLLPPGAIPLPPAGVIPLPPPGVIPLPPPAATPQLPPGVIPLPPPGAIPLLAPAPIPLPPPGAIPLLPTAPRLLSPPYTADVCAICVDPDDVCLDFKLSCGHRYHSGCIQSWFKKERTCPLCRKKHRGPRGSKNSTSINISGHRDITSNGGFINYSWRKISEVLFSFMKG